MLTTAACATIRSDKEMLQALGRDAVPDYMK
jgi:biotin synthase